MDFNQLMYYGGIALLALGFIGGVLAALLLSLAGRRLRRPLETEYGKPRPS